MVLLYLLVYIPFICADDATFSTPVRLAMVADVQEGASKAKQLPLYDVIQVLITI
jgi:hypothetical protein